MKTLACVMTSLALFGCASPAMSQGQGLSHANVSATAWKTHPAFVARVDVDDVDLQTLQVAIFHATNETRARHNLSQLGRHALLDRAAQLHAQRMVDDKFFSHQDPKQSRLRTPKDRGASVGITNPFIAENIAIGTALMYQSGEPVYPLPGRGKFSRTNNGPVIPTHTYKSLAYALVKQWMDSPGHRANILHKDAVELGCGAQLTWDGDWPTFKAVQNFQFFERVQGKRAAGPAAPAPRAQAASAPNTKKPKASPPSAPVHVIPKTLDQPTGSKISRPPM